MVKLILFFGPRGPVTPPTMEVSFGDGEIYSVFLRFLGVYLLGGETNFYFLVE